jgi:hypothetical protein
MAGIIATKISANKPKNTPRINQPSDERPFDEATMAVITAKANQNNRNVIAFPFAALKRAVAPFI